MDRVPAMLSKQNKAKSTIKMYLYTSQVCYGDCYKCKYGSCVHSQNGYQNVVNTEPLSFIATNEHKKTFNNVRFSDTLKCI